MKNNTHTPGPWKIAYGSGIDFRIHADTNGNICTSSLNCPSIEAMDEYETEQVANAKLIASAPLLLEALQALLNARTTDERKYAEMSAEQAINKAIN
jgi:hypothetical protein